MKKVILLGAGGFAREIIETIDYINEHTDENIEPIGFVYDGGDKDKGTRIRDFPVLGDLSCLSAIDRDAVFLIAAAGRSVWRRKMVEEARKYGARFLSIVHPTSIVSKWATMGEGLIIQSACMIQPDVKAGDFFTCNGNVRIGHDAVIGDFVHVNPSVNIAGATVIEDDVFVGMKATIMTCTVGCGSVIGACSLVTKDVPPHVLVKGIPGKHSELREKLY